MKKFLIIFALGFICQVVSAQKQKSAKELGYTKFAPEIDSLFAMQNQLDSIVKIHDAAVSFFDKSASKYNQTIKWFNKQKDQNKAVDSLNKVIELLDSSIGVVNNAQASVLSGAKKCAQTANRISARLKKIADKHPSDNSYINEWNGFVDINNNYGRWLNNKNRIFEMAAAEVNKSIDAVQKEITEFNASRG